MATVTSFEAIQQPTRTELRQFAELFRPLFENSSEASRRQAVAALTQCESLPDSVCYFIGTQPISIAAVFLSCAKAISDHTLIAIARTQGEAHARAIAMRESLSTKVIDALADLHNGSAYKRKPEVKSETPPEVKVEPQRVQPGLTVDEPVTPVLQVQKMPKIEDSITISISTENPKPDFLETEARKNLREAARLAREEALRNQLRELVAKQDTPEGAPTRQAPTILKGLDPVHEALLVRFARQQETALFARSLADTIGASISLADRIMLDISGAQLATTLLALGMKMRDIRFVLCRIYPHLNEASEGRTRAHRLASSLDPAHCVERLAAWRRADHYTNSTEEDFDELLIAANEDDARTIASSVAEQLKFGRPFGRR